MEICDLMAYIGSINFWIVLENSPIGVVSKISDDICQLRLDFQTFSGFATTTPTGTCSDYMSAAGQTGRDPPDICGTNTDYHSKYSNTGSRFHI